jgi:hypothetical protein
LQIYHTEWHKVSKKSQILQIQAEKKHSSHTDARQPDQPGTNNLKDLIYKAISKTGRISNASARPSKTMLRVRPRLQIKERATVARS